MKKTSMQKGITLIALIITIVILLILAVVTINAVKGDGIIRYAQNAATEYEKKANEEQALLNGYLDQLNLNNPNGNDEEDEEPTAPVVAKWEQSGTTITGKTADNTIVYTLAVGDEIGYDCYTGVETTKLSYEVNANFAGNTSYGYGYDGDGQNKTYSVTSQDATRTWTVMGVEDEKILITTTPLTTPLTLGGYNRM